MYSKDVKRYREWEPEDITPITKQTNTGYFTYFKEIRNKLTQVILGVRKK